MNYKETPKVSTLGQEVEHPSNPRVCVSLTNHLPSVNHFLAFQFSMTVYDTCVMVNQCSESVDKVKPRFERNPKM